AVTLARLGVPVAFVGTIGDDEVGRWIREGLGDEGVDVDGLAVRAGPSPLSVVLVERGTGARALAPYPGASAAIALDDETRRRCAAARWVHLDQRGVRILDALRSDGVRTPVSLDGGVDVPDADLGQVDLYVPTEAALLARFPGSLDASLDRALAAGPSTVVVTQGATGSSAVQRAPDGGRIGPIHAPAFELEGSVRSTLGAGDVFHGALLAGLVDDLPLELALARANAVAAMSCAALDGRSAIPSRTELEASLARASTFGEHHDG
ncbi:MAG TPA: carbohydrate kinase family protein, partial [Candidatus Saccharimonadales bacterium]|nr:carbohydrate kinase family protein [Candidatus Saccharimonadales bacterium]